MGTEIKGTTAAPTFLLTLSPTLGLTWLALLHGDRSFFSNIMNGYRHPGNQSDEALMVKQHTSYVTCHILDVCQPL